MGFLGGMIPGWAIKGGVMMIPLFLCSITGLAIIIERAFSLHHLDIDFSDYLKKISKLLGAEQPQAAIDLCESMPEPYCHIFKEGVLNRGKKRETVTASIEEVALLELHKLEKHLPVLSTIVSVSPLLGLLGTVTGMVRSFNVIALQGTGDARALSGGISEALITTVTGLCIAVPALVAYNYFTSQVDYLIKETEKSSIILADIVAAPEE